MDIAMPIALMLILFGWCVYRWAKGSEPLIKSKASSEQRRANVTSSLNNPRSRLGFVIFCLGLSLCIASFLCSYNQTYTSGFANIDDLLIRRLYAWWQTTFRVGLFLLVIGAWTAWLYESTIGKIVNWIKSGSA